MPYNTRRKSLSLPSLGIALPGSSGPRSARSPPSTTTDSHQLQQHHQLNHPQQPPHKKVKRTHSTASNPSTVSASPPRPSTLRLDQQRPKSSGRVAADTPPPSPGSESRRSKVDTQGIDDQIVVGVIEQLEKTGNRPHLLKELAAILCCTIPIVESSANPAAIISSRLATYLKRPWTALSRCPLDKKLVGTHPKRVYYFLTTCPHQPIPANAASNPAAARIISPSLSSAASEEEDADARSRDRMSPSPELDLSSPEFEEGADPFSNQSHPPTSVNISHNRRAQSPPLERDEREFTQTASSLQQRRMSQEAERKRAASMTEPPAADVVMEDAGAHAEESEESAARKNSESAAMLFGHVATFSAEAPSSPLLKPALVIEMPPPLFRPGEANKRQRERDDELELSWADMKSPESIELDELEDLLGEC